MRILLHCWWECILIRHYGEQYGSVGGVCNFLGSVSPQQILKRRMNQCYSSQFSFFFFLVSKGKYILKAWGGPTQKRPTEELSSSILAPLFICFFPPPEPALYKLGGLFASPEVLTLVLRPCFVLFSWAFSFFVFQTLLFWTPFSYSNYLTLLYSIVSTQCSVMT